MLGQVLPATFAVQPTEHRRLPQKGPPTSLWWWRYWGAVGACLEPSVGSKILELTSHRARKEPRVGLFT